MNPGFLAASETSFALKTKFQNKVCFLCLHPGYYLCPSVQEVIELFVQFFYYSRLSVDYPEKYQLHPAFSVLRAKAKGLTSHSG